MPQNPDAAASPAMFHRGHLDHLAINVANEASLEEARQRLLARHASDGVVTDVGVLRSLSFRDPDGLEVEVALWGDQPARRFDERVTTPAQE